MAIRDTGKPDDTLVVFTSDHGCFHGEHGLSVERRLAYEEAIRLPLLMRHPRAITAGSVSPSVVLSLDLAPTLIELGGASVPDGLHGRSLVPILRDRPWVPRRSSLIEHSSDDAFPRTRRMGYKAVRMGRYKPIKYTEPVGMDELYDLEADPYELRDTIDSPSSQLTLKGLEAELSRLRDGSK